MDRVTPKESPLSMPVQDLRTAPERAFSIRFSYRILCARIVTFVGALVLGTLGSWMMWKALGSGEKSVLELCLYVLFTITFYWIALSVSGMLAALFARYPYPKEASAQGEKVAIVMPVYGEDPVITGAALLAMAEQIASLAIKDRCELFIISDTQDADAWVAETSAYETLRQRSPLPVWYRRRAKNIGRKAGNVEEFVKRWGGRYGYMLMLDADSLLQGKTIEALIARMDSEPQLGLLQTAPRMIGGDSLLARNVQFAGALYGGIVAKGVSAWQGEDGNYWGHNALIRTQAFAESCGLPVLEGRRPIGGHIMSHDFVEAALLRRRGWIVRMDADLGGSYEGLPPTLSDFATRERRWAQGNLQHLGVIGAKGLRWPNRVHFAIGMSSFLMSPLWLLLLVVGLMLTAQTLLSQPSYFPVAYQLFPNWPTFDARLMVQLWCFSMLLLFLPKIVSYFAVLLNSYQRCQFGGALALTKSFFLELIISMLYAPIMMLIQSHHIQDIFLGRDSGWSTQERNAYLMSWKQVWRYTFKYVVAGLIPLCILAWMAPNQIIWLSPVIVGLLLSPWLVRHSGDVQLADRLARNYFLLTPEEIDPPAVIRRALVHRFLFASDSAKDFASLAMHEESYRRHMQVLTDTTLYDDEKLIRITAEAKLRAASSVAEGLRFLDKAEKRVIAGTPYLLELWRALGLKEEKSA